jgi:SDR family mycofactocin-dependent oxidoreductase
VTALADRPLAVITGAARGIGAATALRLAADGWPLLLVDACAPQPPAPYEMPTLADLEAVAAQSIARGAPSAAIAQADVTAPEFPDRLRDAIGSRRVGAAVAAAGVIIDGHGWSTPAEAWDRLLDVNLHGVRRLVECTVPSMAEAGEGRLVVVASAAALRAMPLLAGYSAAKAAVVAYVRALAADLAGTGVAANVVCPGSTRGTMLQHSALIYDLPDQEAFADQHLLRRLLEPDEVAALVAWLCGDAASGLTGAVIPVDAGLTA